MKQDRAKLAIETRKKKKKLKLISLIKLKMHYRKLIEAQLIVPIPLLKVLDKLSNPSVSNRYNYFVFPYEIRSHKK